VPPAGDLLPGVLAGELLLPVPLAGELVASAG
jgi:hypothetical protein